MGGIRKLQRHEVIKLVPCARLFHDEAKIPGVFNADSFIGQILALFDSGKWFAFCLFDDNDNAVAGIAGLIYPEVTTGDMTCMEMFWFVRPDHRVGTASLRLLKEYEAQAAAMGAKRIMMTRITGMNDGTLNALFERKGYREFETTYLKEI